MHLTIVQLLYNVLWLKSRHLNSRQNQALLKNVIEQQGFCDGRSAVTNYLLVVYHGCV